MSRLQGVSTTETLPAYSNCASAWSGSVAWASSAAYTTANQLSSLTRFIGAVQSCPSGDVFNTTSEIFKYNVNNQLTDIETGTPVVGSYGNWLKDGSNYILAGYHYSATQNNGQITSMDDGRQEYSVTYQYDLLKRLVSATAGSTWTQTFGYDGFGNLTSKSTPTGSSELPLPGVNPAKNWLTGYTYDANGNVGSYNNYSLGYDPVNRLSYATTGSFIETHAYDASNHRIERINASLDTVYFFSPSGALLSKFNCLSTCTLIYNRIYFGGMVLGTDGAGVSGNPPSALGDVSTWTDRLGSAQSTYPYGTDIGSYPSGADAPDFATYTKEGSTGLEYAMNRYYSGGLGRFPTPDPFGSGAVSSVPQTWNRYAYVGGDPGNNSDLAGLCAVDSAGVNTNQASSNLFNSLSAGQIESCPFSDSASSNIYYGFSKGAIEESLGTTASGVLATAITDAALQTPNSQINLVLVSGSAGTFASLYPNLPANIRNQIGNITYIAPGGGLFSTFPCGSGSCNFLMAGNFDPVPAGAIPTGTNVSTFYDNNCGHDLDCLIKAYKSLILASQGPACPAPAEIDRSNYGTVSLPSGYNNVPSSQTVPFDPFRFFNPIPPPIETPPLQLFFQ